MVAGAHDATAATASAHDAVGESGRRLKQLRNRKIVPSDSNSRFHWMTFNWFLDTGSCGAARVPVR